MPRPPRGIVESDGIRRCWWCGDHDDYQLYHDTEWGRPVHDDQRLFEKMSLEGFQSGLSWLTILRKRENFREAFDGFDFERIACWRPSRVEKLLTNAGIVRHRGKIEAVLENARQARVLCEEFGSLDSYFWGFEPAPGARPRRVTHAFAVSATLSPESTAMAKDLKRRGFRFFGPTTAYAFMQAMGLVNDHLEACAFRAEVEATRSGS